MRTPGVHHTGLTVSDLDRSVEFYRWLGFEEAGRVVLTGEDAELGTGVTGAHVRIAMLRAPNGALFELLEYASPEGGSTAPPNNGTGATHVCVEVEDIDAAAAELKDRGVTFISDPLYHESGVRWVYLKDPDGITAELLQVLE